MTMRWDAESQTYVANATMLRLYSQGRTEDEATEALRSAVRLFLAVATHNRGYCWSDN